MNQISLLREQLSAILPRFAILEEEPLRRHTSFRIGGPAQCMVFPRTVNELQDILLAAREAGVKPLILGAGTNVLAPDEGLRALVVCLKKTFMGLHLTDETHVEAMAGMTLAQTAIFAAQNRLSGLEFAHGIPGTVGGGVYMNAGAYGGELKDCAVQTDFLHMDGRLETVSGDAQGFSYRMSAFQSMDGVIVRTKFALKQSDETEIRAKIVELGEKRRASQPLELPSAGSTFKRPQGGYAAAMIERAGLKGVSVGGAQVSEKHAGFVVNRGDATAKDVLALIALVQARVFEETGVHLEPEVRLWGLA